MKTLRDEIEVNFERFTAQWQAELENVRNDTKQHSAPFLASYEQLTSFGAWAAVLEGQMSQESFAFFREAQNDALVSHVMAQLCAWRVALQAIRSMMENVVVCAFYMDHPVELAMWGEGRHRIGFRSGLEYLAAHPALRGFSEQDTGIATLRQQYALTSQAVHASGRNFRMTNADGETMLWSADQARRGQWRSAERLAVAGVNTLLVALFRDVIGGTSHRGLRKAISLAIGQAHHAEVKNLFAVTLYSP